MRLLGAITGLPSYVYFRTSAPSSLVTPVEHMRSSFWTFIELRNNQDQHARAGPRPGALSASALFRSARSLLNQQEHAC